jgi:4-hydroxy-4-methyl-2-oxoglutarate aldolase
VFRRRQHSIDNLENPVETPNPVLTLGQIEELRQFTAPTIANALELLGSWDRFSGLMAPRIRALFPEMKPIVGYACTSLLSARHPAQGKMYADWPDYWRYVTSVPEPRISVGQDIDPAPSVGSIWGEVQANIHQALGCVGAVVEGAMRDLDEMQALRFPCFARDVVISHGYAHFVDFGNSVEVGGVVVRSGDLIHADRHGVMLIPHDAAPHLAVLCRKIVDAESRLLTVVKDRRSFSVDRLTQAFNRFMEEYPVERPKSM